MAGGKADSILFKKATVIDGTGGQRYVADIAVRDGRIASIQTNSKTDSVENVDRVIDCENGKWCLCPGFIDMHAHSDLSLLHTPDHEAKITQGVTTEVIGQDGISYAPVDEGALQRIRKQISGWNGNPQQPGFFDRWKSVGEFLDVLDAEKTATNPAFLVPQGNLRILVKGYDSSPATQKEIDAMKDILRTALEDGAVGMSSGLTYVPGCFATFDELAQLCEVVKEYGAYYCPHQRSYGRGALPAYKEMIELAKKTGVRLHLTHCTMNFAENAGRADELLVMIDEGISQGLDITLDTYPYLPGSTTLAALLPNWASSTDDKIALFNDPEQLAKIKHQCLVTGTDGCHGCTLDFDIIEISGVQDQFLAEKCVGKTLGQIAREQGQDPFETFIQLLQDDDFGTTIMQHSGHEDNVRKIMRHPKHTGGSDGILTSTKPHPRGWGTFPRYLGHYARDLVNGRSRDIYVPSGEDGHFEDTEPETIFAGGLEEAVSHLTFRATQVLGVSDRGLVKEGYKADLVLFDPDAIRDAATFKRPKQPANGIRTVMVNGEIALHGGKMSGMRAGRTIRLRKGSEKASWHAS